jgi:hypothetical protein
MPAVAMPGGGLEDVLPRKIAKAMRAISLASATATSLKRLGLDELLRPGPQCVFARLPMVEDRTGQLGEEDRNILVPERLGNQSRLGPFLSRA